MLGAGLAEGVKEVVMAGVALEDGLTVGKINDRATWWGIWLVS